MPPSQGRIKLGEFSEIRGENRETFRGRSYRGEAPIPDVDDSVEEIQRTYSGVDVFAYAIFDALVAVGLTAAQASEAVRSSDAARQFFMRTDRGEDPASLLLVDAVEIRIMVIGGTTSEMEVAQSEVMTPDALAIELNTLAGNYGKMLVSGNDGGIKEFGRGFRVRGIVHLMTAYERAKRQCLEKGYEFDGRNVNKLAVRP